MRKATGSDHTLFNPCETAALVPEFAVENGAWKNCSLVSWACSEGPALGQNTLMMMMMHDTAEMGDLKCFKT